MTPQNSEQWASGASGSSGCDGGGSPISPKAMTPLPHFFLKSWWGSGRKETLPSSIPPKIYSWGLEGEGSPTSKPPLLLPSRWYHIGNDLFGDVQPRAGPADFSSQLPSYRRPRSRGSEILTLKFDPDRGQASPSSLSTMGRPKWVHIKFSWALGRTEDSRYI